ncbi:hypothetical protein N7466_007280 [Penicillium verhagenii]|uniref:uncharacterized protein n=1 Tax=Penicillium verhagenii TaxID=1562060 RepID=UPI0025450432|nr:uncharacterized protein N7466_007280 [Penicillium verhagenii]KAJ5928324.1 hypothetical protein N7466_007280 [Penicillium verhagenii]
MTQIGHRDRYSWSKSEYLVRSGAARRQTANGSSEQNGQEHPGSSRKTFRIDLYDRHRLSSSVAGGDFRVRVWC